MLELPEATCAGTQLNKALTGRQVKRAVAAQTPHGFAWYHGDPKQYGEILDGHTVQKADGLGNYVRLFLDGTQLVLGEGIRIRLLGEQEKRPPKHQLLLEFEDGTAMVCSVQMYGGMWAARPEDFDNQYYQAALDKPSPLTGAFGEVWFGKLWANCPQKHSAKAFLATEQRIPGLGNGVLQDILFNARVHPKAKLSSLDDGDMDAIFKSVKTTLADMTEQGGRDTEKDVFGWPGGYNTLMSAKTAGSACPVCGDIIQKQAYMGGSIYFCPTCQPLAQ